MLFNASDDWRSGPREDIVGSIETSIKTGDVPAIGKRGRAAGAIVGHMASPDAF